MNEEWIDNFYLESDLWPNRTGQGSVEAGNSLFGGRYNYDESEDIRTKNLGLGGLYYSLARLYKPRTSLIIGSGRGFFPIITAKGMVDNDNGGVLHFIDPSLDDDFWKDKKKNDKWFLKFGINNVIKHHLQRTQDFIKTDAYKKINNIEFLGIDGSHFYEYVKFDFNAFKNKLSDRAIILFHDSISRSKNPKWNGPRQFLLELLKDNSFQSFDLKFGAGLTLVQKKFYEHQQLYMDSLEENWKNKNNEEF